MKNVLASALVVTAVLLLSACGQQENQTSDKHQLQVVTSFTILEDMAEQIGGDYVEVHNLVPSGSKPHNYEPAPEDNKQAADADILLYNGLNLEGGEEGWFINMVRTVGQNQSNVFAASKGIEPVYIGDGHQKEQNPHAFIDPGNGIQMAKNIRDALIEIDPEREKAYNQQGNDYIEHLKTIEHDYEDKLGDIPEEDRILVTIERAFKYLANHYDIKEGFLYEIDTKGSATPKQIKDLVGFIKQYSPPVLFVESNHDKRPMETVSSESGVPIYDKPIHSGDIGGKGGAADTYEKYLKYNLDVMYNGLTNQ